MREGLSSASIFVECAKNPSKDVVIGLMKQ
jgi:hypothetical protein